MIKTFGDFVRERRDLLDISLREFAKRLGDVSPAHISDIENGRRHPSRELQKKMSQLLGVSVAEMEKYDSRPPMDELKRLAQKDPAYGLAFRQIAEKKVDPAELLKFLEKKPKKG